MRRKSLVAAVAAATGAVVAAATVPAWAATVVREDTGGITVVARDLDGPYGLDTRGSGFVVAENDTGDVASVAADGRRRILLTGAGGVSGVAQSGGLTFAALGGPNEDGSPQAGKYPASSVLRLNAPGTRARRLANLLNYELKHNPDMQVQYVNGQPVDALSNPFSANYSGAAGLLIADGGANDVLKVDPVSGRVSTFFVPPNVTDVDACLQDGAQANPGTVGCDSVPTGVAVARGSVYVSTLGADVPGAGKVYQLDPRSGAVRRVWNGFTSPTGIAVGPDGSIYLSEATYNAPQGDPGPDFDPSTIGRITRIAPDGSISHAAVTMPIGMVFRRGDLYSTAWALGIFLGIPHAGQIVKVDPSAFVADAPQG